MVQEGLENEKRHSRKNVSDSGMSIVPGSRSPRTAPQTDY